MLGADCENRPTKGAVFCHGLLHNSSIYSDNFSYSSAGRDLRHRLPRTRPKERTQRDFGPCSPSRGPPRLHGDEAEWLLRPPSSRSAKRSLRMFAHGEDRDEDEPANDTPVKLSRRCTKKSQFFGSSTDCSTVRVNTKV